MSNHDQQMAEITAELDALDKEFERLFGKGAHGPEPRLAQLGALMERAGTLLSGAQALTSQKARRDHAAKQTKKLLVELEELANTAREARLLEVRALKQAFMWIRASTELTDQVSDGESSLYGAITRIQEEWPEVGTPLLEQYEQLSQRIQSELSETHQKLGKLPGVVRAARGQIVNAIRALGIPDTE